MKQNLGHHKFISLKIRPVMNTINQYIKEFKHLKLYIISVSLVLISSYSVYLFLNDETVSNLGKEDHFFEWMQAIFLMTGFLILFTHYLKTKNYIILLLSLVLLFGCGEEISWGQRIFGFKTPDSIVDENLQHEFNLHNLETFSGMDYHHKFKKGFERFFAVNFLFRLFTMLWGIFLPFLAYHAIFFYRLTLKLKLPIPPISIGIFFFINWFTYWIVHSYVISENGELQNAYEEIFETVAIFIILVICLYFLFNINKTRAGNDIKETLH